MGFLYLTGSLLSIALMWDQNNFHAEFSFIPFSAKDPNVLYLQEIKKRELMS